MPARRRYLNFGGRFHLVRLRPGQFLLGAEAATMPPALLGGRATTAVALAGKGSIAGLLHRDRNRHPNRPGQVGNKGQRNGECSAEALQRCEESPHCHVVQPVRDGLLLSGDATTAHRGCQASTRCGSSTSTPAPVSWLRQLEWHRAARLPSSHSAPGGNRTRVRLEGQAPGNHSRQGRLNSLDES